MNFYSGFSLKNDKLFFNKYLSDSDYTVSGFSYGAILAFKDVKSKINRGERVDKLQLLSPAFFQTKSSKFKRLQTIAYTKSRDLYLKTFIKSCFLPYAKKDIELSNSSIEELNELLNFEWNLDELLELESRGLKIEVYLGSEDKIIDIGEAREFFLNVSTVTYIKKSNNFYQIN